jgi:hypothetical protein
MPRVNAEAKETPVAPAPKVTAAIGVRLECRRFPPGTKERIDAALEKHETFARFFRSAVEHELTRREQT